MKRPFLVAGISAFAAAALREFLFYDAFFDLFFIIISVFLSFGFILLTFFIKSRREILTLFSVFFTVFAVFSGLWTYRNNSELQAYDSYSGKTVNCEAEIIEEPTLTENKYYRYVGEIISPENLKGIKIIFYGFSEENISFKSRVSGNFILEKPKERNYYYRYNNISFFAGRNFGEELLISSPDQRDPLVLVNNIKIAAESKIEYLFGDLSGVVKGFLFGNTDDMSIETKTDFRVSGLSHLLAVSGLHIGIISLFIITVFSKSKKRGAPYIIASLFIILTAALSGFSPSVCRAVIMQLILFAGKFFYKKGDTKNTFGFALFILIFINPFIVSSPSFLLSFSATAAIIFLFKPVYGFVATSFFRRFSIVPSGIFRKLTEVSVMSVLCTAATLPVSYFYFGTFSFLGIFGNILALPFVSVTFITAILSVVISFLPLVSFYSMPFMYVSKIGVFSIMYVTRFLSFLSGNITDYSLDMSFVSDYWILLSVAAVALLGVLLWLIFSKPQKGQARNRNRLKRVVSGALAVIVISLAVFFFTEKSEEVIHSGDKITATFIDVGQGNGVVLTQNENVYVYDCGGTQKPGDSCAEYILSEGYTEIDAVIISHMHDDHMNGVKKLLEKIRAREVIIPYTTPDKEEEASLKEFLDKKGIKLTILYEDTKTVLDSGAGFSLLLKHMDEDADENDNSIVLALDYYNTDLLLCGDLSKVGEKCLIKEYPELDTDILSVGHHGSKYSACEEFLKQITPEVSVISVAEKNSYGHPDADTVSRLEACGDVYCTKDYGNISFILDGKEYTIKTEKQEVKQ